LILLDILLRFLQQILAQNHPKRTNIPGQCIPQCEIRFNTPEST